MINKFFWERWSYLVFISFIYNWTLIFVQIYILILLSFYTQLNWFRLWLWKFREIEIQFNLYHPILCLMFCVHYVYLNFGYPDFGGYPADGIWVFPPQLLISLVSRLNDDLSTEKTILEISRPALYYILGQNKNTLTIYFLDHRPNLFVENQIKI